jgi:hypothetical protein
MFESFEEEISEANREESHLRHIVLQLKFEHENNQVLPNTEIFAVCVTVKSNNDNTYSISHRPYSFYLSKNAP